MTRMTIAYIDGNKVWTIDGIATERMVEIDVRDVYVNEALVGAGYYPVVYNKKQHGDYPSCRADYRIVVERRGERFTRRMETK